MEYLYTQLIGEPHELCQWAKEDIEKAYKDSCKKAIKDIAQIMAKRERLNKEALELSIKLRAAYDIKDTLLVSDILEEIVENLKG